MNTTTQHGSGLDVEQCSISDRQRVRDVNQSKALFMSSHAEETWGILCLTTRRRLVIRIEWPSQLVLAYCPILDATVGTIRVKVFTRGVVLPSEDARSTLRIAMSTLGCKGTISNCFGLGDWKKHPTQLSDCKPTKMLMWKAGNRLKTKPAKETCLCVGRCS